MLAKFQHPQRLIHVRFTHHRRIRNDAALAKLNYLSL
jgi:hypothetical protein